MNDDHAEARQIALNLARNCGWLVLPVRADKAPACPGGFKSASKDPDAIAELWRRWPAPLIGIATGEASGVAVLDLDAKHPEAVRWWRANEKRLPETRAFRTRSGGLHCYFRHSPGLRCSTGRPVPGLDVRADGGYAVCWYAAGLECLDHAAPAPWPAWLANEIWQPRPPAPAPVAVTRRPRGSADRALAGVLRVVETAAEGERNSRLHWSTRRLAERGVPEGEALALLVPAAIAAGLPAVEARRTVASAMRSAGRGA